MSSTAPADHPTLFGHPTGLFNLFFAEMWERFSYYGMRALLVFYMIKGFLGYGDKAAYAVYGAYTALVYMTPFFGGILADRLLGARRAVVLGGLLMAAGHLTMTLENDTAFFVALALLIVGNGFFKPNISTIVGGLYKDGGSSRDGGFTIFYMGINLGAAMAPLLCGYVGETFGWHYGFGLATIGMLVGLAVFAVPTRVAQGLILVGALATAISMVALQEDAILLAVNAFVALALAISGGIAFAALNKGGIPGEAGQPPADAPKTIAGVPTVPAVVAGTLLVVPALAWLVSSARTIRLIPPEYIEKLSSADSPFVQVAASFMNEVATPPGLVLFVSGAIAVAFILMNALKGTRVERERLFVVLILMFFSMLFWAFFEQAGSSINNFTDRNVDRVREDRVITQADVGQTLTFEPTQEQLGHTIGGKVYTLGDLDAAREAARKAEKKAELSVQVDASHVGMGVGGSEIPASTFQAANPIFILLFGLGFTALWGFLASRRMEPNTPIKFSLGLAQLGLGFGALWYGAAHADARGMVGVSWLIVGYLLHTTGELCLSPVGLSAMTKLAPARIASTVMGAWFLATSFSSLLAGIIATFTGVGHGGGDEKTIPAPIETVGVYGEVFGQIGLACAVSTVLLLVLSPILSKWMHEDVASEGEPAARAAH
ncbi:MAG: peptide MFS transporter [Myxococcota bacterium]